MEDIKQICDIENKYGLIVFRMGLTHLVDVGIRFMNDENVQESIKQIMNKEAEEKSGDKVSILTPELQCEILRCAADTNPD